MSNQSISGKPGVRKNLNLPCNHNPCVNQEDIELELAADYKFYTVAGNSVRIGQQMASIQRDWNGPSLDELSPGQIHFARKCAEVVSSKHPPLIQELKTTANLMGKTTDEAFFFLSMGMTETSRRSHRRRRHTINHKCSTVGILTKDGPVIGRNYDLSCHVHTRHLIITRPSGYIDHAGMFSGFVAGRQDGINSHGLFVSLHTVRSNPPLKTPPGLFCVHVIRILLETCKNVKEAIGCITNMPHLSSYNYFIADPAEMAVVETHPERVRVRSPKDGILACTNHFLHPDMLGFLPTVPQSSGARLEFLIKGARRLREAHCLNTIETSTRLDSLAEDIATLMRDHTVPVCWHTEPVATLWSAIAFPSEKMISYCFGAPCRNDYSYKINFETMERMIPHSIRLKLQ